MFFVLFNKPYIALSMFNLCFRTLQILTYLINNIISGSPSYYHSPKMVMLNHFRYFSTASFFFLMSMYSCFVLLL